MNRSVFGITILLVALLAPVVAHAQDEGLVFVTKLQGLQEVPPVETKARGYVAFEVDDSRTKLEFEWVVRGGNNILGATGAHIHCAPAGENGPVAAFIGGVVEGGLQGEVEMEGTLTDQNVLKDAGCGSNIAELVDEMLAGNTYVNIHSLDFPSGEVRGQLELEEGE